jgi:hypothetical protein
MTADDPLASAPPGEAVTLVLRLWLADALPCGSITAGESGPVVNFHGWIELMAVINQLQPKSPHVPMP